MTRSLDAFVDDLREAGIRVWLDAGELRFHANDAAVAPTLLAELTERKAALTEFLRRANEAARTSAPLTRRRGTREFAPLSFAQERMWFLQRLAPDSAAYNMPIVIRIDRAPNLSTLEQSIAGVAQRHDVLRMTVATDGEAPIMRIAREGGPPVRLADLSRLDCSAAEVAASRLLAAEGERPFVLERD